MLVLLDVCKETLLNALIVRVVAGITLAELLSALVRKLKSDLLHGVGVKLLWQLQDRDGVSGNRRALGTANHLKSAHEESCELSRRVREELLVSSIVHFALHRLDRQNDMLWLGKLRLWLAGQCLLNGENE